MARPLRTPDGRYFVIEGRLKRAANPGLPDERRRAFVDELMKTRRALKRAKAAGDARASGEVRERVHAIKVALGERGTPWWGEGPVCDNLPVEDSPYAAWWRQRLSG